MSNISYLHGNGCHYGVTIHGIQRMVHMQSKRLGTVLTGLQKLEQKSLSPRSKNRFKQAQLYLLLARQEIEDALDEERRRMLRKDR